MGIEKKIYRGQRAVEYLPDIISDNSFIVISPVRNIYYDNKNIGILIFSEKQIVYNNSTVKSKDFSQAQREKFKYSFLFLATNANVFNNLFKTNFSGKITKNDNVVLDDINNQIYSFFSNDFMRIIKNEAALL